MTDKEKVEKLFTELGVGFASDETGIVCCEGKPKVGGYTEFYTAFRFTDEGKFIEMGAYE